MEPTHSHRDCIGLLAAGFMLWAAGLPAFSAGAQESAVVPSTVSNRCLLVVETSRAMQRRVPNVLESVKGLLNSGLGDHLRPGDALGLWTFDDGVVSDRFPFQAWSPENQLLSVRLLDFLQTRNYDKRASLQKLAPELARVVRTSEFITVVLICSGEGEMQGTPFDDRINQAFKQWQSEQQKARMPLLILLRGEAGKLVECSVTPAPWPLEMPALPARLASRATAASPAPPLATAPTNPPPAVVPVPAPVTNLGASSPEPPKAVLANSAPPPTAAPRTNTPVAAASRPATNRLAALQPTNSIGARFSESFSPVERAPAPALTNRAQPPFTPEAPSGARPSTATSAAPVTTSTTTGATKSVQQAPASVPTNPLAALAKPASLQPKETQTPLGLPKAAPSVSAAMVKPEVVQAANPQVPESAVKTAPSAAPSASPPPLAADDSPAPSASAQAPTISPGPPSLIRDIRKKSTPAESAAQAAPPRETGAIVAQTALGSPPDNFFRANALWLGLMLLTAVAVFYFFAGWLASYRRPQVQLVTLPIADSPARSALPEQALDTASPFREESGPAADVSAVAPGPRPAGK